MTNHQQGQEITVNQVRRLIELGQMIRGTVSSDEMKKLKLQSGMQQNTLADMYRYQSLTRS